MPQSINSEGNIGLAKIGQTRLCVADEKERNGEFVVYQTRISFLSIKPQYIPQETDYGTVIVHSNQRLGVFAVSANQTTFRGTRSNINMVDT